MKKKYTFTKDSSFSSVKDQMHTGVTEHYIKDDETEKLYHYVVSYGSWFHISEEAVFMSHLLEKIGVTGFSKAYIAEDSKIVLPWYPSSGLLSKNLVELPEWASLKCCEFGKSKGELCDDFKKTFLAKKFKVKTATKEDVYTASYVIKEIFGTTTFDCGTLKVEGKDYPLYCLLTNYQFHTKQDMLKILQKSDICKKPEVREILKRFAKISLTKEAKMFKEETQKDLSSLILELKERQLIVKTFLLLKHESEKEEELEV